MANLQLQMEHLNHNHGAVIASAMSTVVKKQRSLIPERWSDQVRAIDASEYKEAGHSIAQAFATDELAHYLLDSDDMAEMSAEIKWRLHVDIMNYIVAAHCYSGLVTTIGPDYEGVAIWAPPGSNTDDWWTTMRSGIWRLYYQLPSGGRHRYFVELLPMLHDTMNEVMGDRTNECYYLVYLGTKPSGQRRGYGKKLIETMAAKADAENRAMYLESSSDKNNVYYRKFGFEHKKDVFLGSSATAITNNSTNNNDGKEDAPKKQPVRLSIMVREPRTLVGKNIPIKLGPGFRGFQ